MFDVYDSLGSAQDSANKCANSAILGKDFLTSSPPSYLGQQTSSSSSEKRFPTALVVGGLVVAGVALYYATQVGGALAANPADDKTYDVWQFSGQDGYEEASGLSWDEAVAEAQEINARTGRVVKIFDSEQISASFPDMPKAKKTFKARKENPASHQQSLSYVIKNAGWSSDLAWQEMQALGYAKLDGDTLYILTDDSGDAPPKNPRAGVLIGRYRKDADGDWEYVDSDYYDDLRSALGTRRNNDEYSPFPVELLAGGRASGMRPSDFDPDELRRGTEHELEHTDDWRIAQEIAMDHLAEDEAYYEKLEAMERGIRDNPSEQQRWEKLRADYLAASRAAEDLDGRRRAGRARRTTRHGRRCSGEQRATVVS